MANRSQLLVKAVSCSRRSLPRSPTLEAVSVGTR